MRRAVAVMTVALGALLCAVPASANGSSATKGAAAHSKSVHIKKVHYKKHYAHRRSRHVAFIYRRPDFPRYTLRSDYFPHTFVHTPIRYYDAISYGVAYRPSYRRLYYRTNPIYVPPRAYVPYVHRGYWRG